MWWKKLIKNTIEKLEPDKTVRTVSVAVLLVITIYLRFWHLGYSDYIGDEHKSFIQPEAGQTVWEFFLAQRKGPMQFLVSHVPYLITGDFRNELAERIPYALVSSAAIYVFYLLVKKITDNAQVAWLSAFLLTVNGFIVGFGRIAQYQNLNLLFSFLALYFYADLIKSDSAKVLMKSSLLGTFFWCLSILSHWDAVFILPVVVIVFIRFLKSGKYNKELKIKLVAYNFILGCVLLLPYLIPYANHQLTTPENAEYFRRRVQAGYVNNERFKELIELYNPFITFHFLMMFGFLGALWMRKSYLFTTWFIFVYLVFEMLVRKPGTHIYNFIIPAVVLSAMAICYIFEALPRQLKRVWVLMLGLVLAFMLFQTHYIFIDHKKEYPWEQKVFYDLTNIQEWNYDRQKVKTRDRVYTQIQTKDYDIEQKLPLFGFPHRRYWNEINRFINEENEKYDYDLEYLTNEVKTISEWYMETNYGIERPFFLIGIKYPLSFREDYKYPQIGGKTTIKEIENESGETVVRIYYVKER